MKRAEDFQSSCRSGTMCHHRSQLVSIQALTPVSAGRFYRFEHIVPYSSFKAHSKQARYFEVRLLFLRQRKVYVLPRFRHKTSTAEKAMQDRPSPYRRPLRILISRKAGLYITLGGLDHHTPSTHNKGSQPMKTKPTIHGITTNRLPEVKKGKYSDGHPLDTVQYLECKIILKGDRFTAESKFDDFARIVKQAAQNSDVDFSRKGFKDVTPQI